MRVLVICNPISGGGRGRRFAERLEKLLPRDGHRLDLFMTGKAGDARERASAIDSDVERIVVVGGDGTLSEVLNGLDDPARVPLTQLATGTANLLAHDLDLPRKPEGVARLLESGTIRRLDMGLAGDRRFLMVASAGFDAMVTLETQRNRQGTMSYFKWLPAILRVLQDYAPPRLSVEIDDRDPVQGELVIVGNTRNYGGLFMLADRTRVDSGHLDVCVLTRSALPALLRAAVAGLTVGLARSSGVIYATGRRVGIDSPAPVPVQIDGDPCGCTPLEITVRPGVVPVVVP